MKLNLLCVTDDSSMSDMISYLAKRAGFNTRIARMDNFPTIYQEFHSHVIVMDIFSFEKEATRLLQYLENFASTEKLIMLSAAQDNDRMRANRVARKLNLSLHAHIYKPFNALAIQEILYELYLSLNTQSQQLRASDNA